MLSISKDRSILIKGIVIIMMVFLHLFNKSNTDLCTNLLYIGDEPFAKWLSRACNPVWFFVLLSGYGLAYTYEKGNLQFTKQLKRIFKLYMHYWIILAVFLCIGCSLYPGRYPGTWDRILVNAVGWETNYNYEMWFILPYSLVALTSQYIIRGIEKIGYILSVVLTIFLSLAVLYTISRYHSTLLSEYPILSLTAVYVQFLYPFTVGVAFCRSNYQWSYQMPTWLALVIMVILVSAVCSIRIPVWGYFYVPLMIYLFCQLQFPKWLNSVFMALGRKSMAIWMIHTWFCYYLFREEVYSLKYPVLILGGVLIISYLTAIPFMWITKKLLTLLRV